MNISGKNKTLVACILAGLLGSGVAHALDLKKLQEEKAAIEAQERAGAAKKKAEQDEQSAWTGAASANTRSAYEQYLARFAKGPHAGEARSRIAAFKVKPKGEPETKREVAKKSGGTTPAPGTVFKDCSDCPQMVVVPAGHFKMGSPDSEPGRESDEGPQHDVSIPRPFAVGQYEVTFDEWDACAADGGCFGYRPNDEGLGRGKRPVINVSWNDAQLYVQWLSRKTGKQYRLLSEAEWEYVARAGTTTPFWTGNCVTTSQANYDGEFDYNGCGAKTGTYRRQTVPVGSFAPNGFGLYDVAGNVWEWVQDCKHDNYNGAPGDGSAWSSDSCSYRVIRGGSWIRPPQLIRMALRNSHLPSVGDSDYGLRIARTL